MSLTEREKEIALELYYKNGGCNGSSDFVSLCDLFLSRISEEQEAAAYMSITGQCAKHLSVFEVGGDKGPFAKLFTTPSAAPDCSELVEVLKKIAYDSIPRGEDPESYISRLAINALANHAKRMKLTQAISGEERCE